MQHVWECKWGPECLASAIMSLYARTQLYPFTSVHNNVVCEDAHHHCKWTMIRISALQYCIRRRYLTMTVEAWTRTKGPVAQHVTNPLCSSALETRLLTNVVELPARKKEKEILTGWKCWVDVRRNISHSLKRRWVRHQLVRGLLLVVEWVQNKNKTWTGQLTTGRTYIAWCAFTCVRQLWPQ